MWIDFPIQSRSSFRRFPKQQAAVCRTLRTFSLTTYYPLLYTAPLWPAMSEYDSLHRQCRTLESLFDTKLTSYSRLASTISRNQDDVEASGSTERWKDLEVEVEELLQNVRM